MRTDETDDDDDEEDGWRDVDADKNQYKRWCLNVDLCRRK